jgi:hypothetical protein
MKTEILLLEFFMMAVLKVRESIENGWELNDGEGTLFEFENQKKTNGSS